MFFDFYLINKDCKVIFHKFGATRQLKLNLKPQKKHQLSLREYKVIYNNFYTSLCLFSNNYVGDLDQSKDIVQEVFIKIWENNIVFENRNAIKSYLYTAVKNKSLDLLKSKEYNVKSQISKEELELLDSDSFFEKEMVIEEVSRIVESALGTLPEKCKKIVKLSMNGYRNYQISEELSISINTVKAQKRIAYQKLRPILKTSFIFLGVFIRLFFL